MFKELRGLLFTFCIGNSSFTR